MMTFLGLLDLQLFFCLEFEGFERLKDPKNLRFPELGQ